MIPKYTPIEKGIVVRRVENPRPISEFPENIRREMHLKYTLKRLAESMYNEIGFVGSNAVIHYELVPEEGFDNLYDAYVDWWNESVKLASYWKRADMVKPPLSWKSQPFYPINPTEDKIEKEKTMIYTVNEKAIKRVIRCTKDRIECACNQLGSMSFNPGDKYQNSLQIASEIKQIANDIERAVNHLKFLSELQGASSIQMNEQEYARFYMDLSAE